MSVARTRTLVLLCLPFLSTPGAAQTVSAELFAGTAWSLPLPLVIHQAGAPTVRLRARYSTRPWSGSPYYAYRLAVGSEPRWEAELVHHKLYLENPSPEIRHFEISHGYNLATANHARPVGSGVVIRFGVGVVVAHPEGEIRGRPVGPVRSLLGGGYHLGGLTTQLAVGRPVALGEGFHLLPEAKITASSVRVPLAGGGFARVPNAALHALAGLGYTHSR